MKLSKQQISDLVARGATLGPSVQLPREERTEEPKAAKLIEPSMSIWGKNNIGRPTTLVILVAMQTVSETNQRQWKARSRRSGQAWRAVREAIGPNTALLEPFASHCHYGKALRVTFTRLGGRKMDRSNLPAAMKGVEDAIAFLLGCDDGDPRWHSFFEQETGGKVGVRIEVEIYA